MIEARGATLRYIDHGREVFACREAHLAVRPGEFVGILGPSGSGKSSLLYLLSGLKKPSSGQILYDGRDLHSRTEAQLGHIRLREFGFVFQAPFLVGYLTALENTVVAAHDRTTPEEARALLEELGIGHLAHRFPHELSGGEKQRVCLARALLGGKLVLFADEPTAALDRTTGAQVVSLLSQKRGDGALVMVTHDPSMLEHADRIFLMEDGRLRESDYS